MASTSIFAQETRAENLSTSHDPRSIDWLVDFNFGIDCEPNLTFRMRRVIELIYPELIDWVKPKGIIILNRQIKRLFIHAERTDDWFLQLLSLWYLANHGQDRHKSALIYFLQQKTPPFAGDDFDEISERLIAPLIVFWSELRQMQRESFLISLQEKC